jgi:hypothetical protein
MFLQCCNFNGENIYKFRINKNNKGEFFDISDKNKVESLINGEGFFGGNPINHPKDFIKYAISYDNSTNYFYSIEYEKNKFRNIVSNIVNSVFAKNENYKYIHDPTHENYPGPGWERTKNGWSFGRINQIFSYDKIEGLLKKFISEIKPSSVVRNAGYSSNSVFRVKRPIELNGRKKEVGTFFKPTKKSLAYRKHMNKNCTQTDREVMSYQFSKALNFNVVPPTFYSTIKGKEGSEQFHVRGEEIGNLDRATQSHINYYLFETERMNQKLQKIAVFDIITGNTDRHQENLLYDEEKRNFHAIDNGLTFPENNVGFFNPQKVLPYYGKGNEMRSCAVTLLHEYGQAEKLIALGGCYNADFLRKSYEEGRIFQDQYIQDFILSIDERKIEKLFKNNPKFNDGQRESCLERLKFLKELIQ